MEISFKNGSIKSGIINNSIYYVKKAKNSIKRVSIAAPLALASVLTVPFTLSTISAIVGSLGLSGCGGGGDSGITTSTGPTSSPSTVAKGATTSTFNGVTGSTSSTLLNNLNYPGTLHAMDAVFISNAGISVGTTALVSSENLPTSLSGNNMIRFAPGATAEGHDVTYFDLTTGNIYTSYKTKSSTYSMATTTFKPDSPLDYVSYKSLLQDYINKISNIYLNCSQTEKVKVKEVKDYLESYYSSLTPARLTKLFYPGVLYRLGDVYTSTIFLGVESFLQGANEELPSSVHDDMFIVSSSTNPTFVNENYYFSDSIYLDLYTGNILREVIGASHRTWETVTPSQTGTGGFQDLLGKIYQRILDVEANGASQQKESIVALKDYVKALLK